MGKYQINQILNFTVSRAEPNFDRASDEAYRYALEMFGADDDGHLSNVDGYDRSNCCLHVRFVDYTRVGGMGGQSHDYTFQFQVKRNSMEDDE